MKLEELESSILCSKEENINYVDILLKLIEIIKELDNRLVKLEKCISTFKQYMPE